jgi:N-hydroxyarylamine O-acetyltransferase
VGVLEQNRCTMDTTAYLRRINYHGPLDPTAETLRALHKAHLLAVPFENLSIHLGEPIVLDQGALFEKIVRRRRGGFCYELNGLFAALLRDLGFDVTMLSAGVARGDGSFGPEFDHLTLLITISETGESVVRGPWSVVEAELQRTTDNRQRTRWLADVGFGDSFCEPLRLDEPGEQLQDGRAFRIDRAGPQLILLRQDEGATWQPQYRFTLQPRQHADYLGMCHYHQTSPESSFTRKRVCTRATPAGRVTLSDLRLIVTEHGERQERLLADQAEFAAALRELFEIDLTQEQRTKNKEQQ